MNEQLNTPDVKITQFLDDDGRITKMPKKHTPRLAVLMYLSCKFECERIYTEHEVNEICDEWSTIGDYFLLRRELVESKLLDRKRDGSEYWKVTAEK